MYRLVLYALLVMGVCSLGLSLFGVLPFEFFWLAISAGTLLVFAQVSNLVFASVFKAPTNTESAVITALILFFVMTPAFNTSSVFELAMIAIIAMATKYCLAVRKKHIFNPAAAGAVIGPILGFGASSWWVLSLSMLPVTLILGFLVVRKLRRFHMFFSFAVAGIFSMVLFGLFKGNLSVDWLLDIPLQAFTVWPLVFFGAFMLTEPLTTPPTKNYRLVYGAIAGLLFGSPVFFAGFYLTSEMALVVSNIFSFIVGAKKNLILWLRERRELAPSIFEFIFDADRRLDFVPGQYMEWSLPHKNEDTRGVRRYFTIASSPTEKQLRLATKIIDKSSSYKKALFDLRSGESLTARGLSGDFVMPENTSRKLVFIAGGIGITPYRSMIKFLIDKGERRDIILFYMAQSPTEFVYRDIFAQARDIGLRVVYVLTKSENTPPDWIGEVGFLNRAMISSVVQGWKDRTYYISGPEGMVSSYTDLLKSMGVAHGQIITDYFPGY